MTLNVMTLATINLIVQFLLVIAVLIAVLRVKKRDLGRHCSIMRGAVPVQIISIITVMLPSMIGYIRNEPPGILFRLEIQAHHLLGLAVVVLWIYINLLFMGKVKGWISLITSMRLAFVLWVSALLLGLHMYLLIWV